MEFLGKEDDLKISIKSHIEHLYSILIYGSVFLLGPVLFRNKIPDGYEEHFKLWALFGFAFYFVPHLCLHLRYWYTERSTQLLMSKDEISIKIKRRPVLVIPFSDIARIRKYETLNTQFKFIQFFPWDSYWYWEIETRNDRRIVVTNLLLNHFSLEVNHIPVEERISFYPWP